MENQAQTNAAVFDISQFEAADTAWCELLNKKEDGPLMYNGKPVRALVRSPGTKEAISAQHKIDLATQNKTFAAIRGKPVKESAEAQIEQRADKLAAVTVEFDNFPVSPIEVFKNPKLGYLTAQIERFHGAWENF